MKSNVTALLSSLPLRMATAQADVVLAREDDGEGAMPPELRQWLVRLRLGECVPFAYLVADTELLPPESIRFFYVDRRWTDALVQGALSVGTVNSDDRTQLAARYAAVRDELDGEERNVRRTRDSARWTGGAGPISGFLLRSQAVSGWPAMHVRAFSVDPDVPDDAVIPEDDPRRMRLLRLERLAPAVLLCLFDGIPRTVHIEEPRQGVQFGFDSAGQGAEVRATLRPRNAATFEYLPGVQPIAVPFRAGANGVVDIQALERELHRFPQTGAGDGLDSAEYALQLVRFPFRQVWGDPKSQPVNAVFRATVSYEVLASTMFKGIGQ
jgi:hypothetical protein